ncbi:MAG TPA: ribose-5-phosphate isomerase RpiA [Steroidobacteraceae bacterium]|nr:ribose-5-phosphate isomerase RpiA [Steroidobacteraceae bacterium]
MSALENKRRAAQAALRYLREDTTVGIGTGSTVNCLIESLAAHPLRLKAVASSEATAKRLAAIGIEVVDLNDAGELALYVDGADEATRRRHLIKGGGGALTREKIVAEAAREFICIIDATKLVEKLGTFPLPIEVIPMARNLVARRLARFGGRSVWRRGFVTDNGNHILDVHGLAMDDPPALESDLNQITGVVTVGLFAERPADLLLLGSDSGVVEI